jgi:lysyl-tRNA synthetase class 2
VPDRRLRRDPAPWIAALIAACAGSLNLASIVWPSFDDSRPFQTLLPWLGTFEVSRPAAVAISAAVGAGLLVLAGGLRRGLRWAWLATVTLLIGGVVVHLAERGEVVQAVLEAAFAGWLLGKAGSFRARRGPGDRRKIVVPTLRLAGLTAGYALAGLAVNSPSFLRTRGVWGSVVEVGRMAIGYGTTQPLPDAFGRVFPGSVTALFFTGAVLMVLRAVAPRRVVSAPPPTPEELRASDDSLAYFATRDDRISVRVRDGLVSYGVAGSVALAAGDPFGPREAWPAVVDGFLAQAAETALVPAVIGCGSRAAKIYRSAGMRRVYLGDEAVLDLERFDIETPERKGAREGWNRGIREGLTATLTRSGDLGSAPVSELRELSEHWLGDADERGFSMALSRLFDPRDAGTWFLVARDKTDRVVGFIHLVPWSSDGAGVDAMRRDREAPNVVNDFLIVEAARLLPEAGVKRLSLNFAFLRGLLEAAERGGAPWWARLEARAIRALSGSFQIESLYRFNEKFDPRWHRRYACVQSISDVPRVAVAMGRAEGQFHAPWDRLHRRAEVEVSEQLAAKLPVAPEPSVAVAEASVLSAPVAPEPTCSHRLADVRSCAEVLDPGGVGDQQMSVTGIIQTRRVLGGLAFWVLESDGDSLQIMLDRKRLGADAYLLALRLETGDRVWVEGVAACSQRGEPSVLAMHVLPVPASLTSPRPPHTVR